MDSAWLVAFIVAGLLFCGSVMWLWHLQNKIEDLQEQLFVARRERDHEHDLLLSERNGQGRWPL